MKPKYIISAIFGIAFVALAFYSFDSSKVEYSDFQTALRTSATVQIIGQHDKTKESNYNQAMNVFSFVLIDEKKQSSEVQYQGAKPMNFDIAPMLVVQGRFENNIFIASNILTKCPSKYEGKFEEIKQKKQ